ncbi:MAG: hypothetical protein MZV65_12160 [Chromatiales bacterium]|nr:hypothetical protein [Chromatiales bacterium]
MWEILRVNPRAFYWSLGLHLLFALFFFFGVDVLKPTLDAGSKARVVQASLVSDRALEALVVGSGDRDGWNAGRCDVGDGRRGREAGSGVART